MLEAPLTLSSMQQDPDLELKRDLENLVGDYTAIDFPQLRFDFTDTKIYLPRNQDQVLET
jgi:hypothetical protein